jgi:hypothetical protein
MRFRSQSLAGVLLAGVLLAGCSSGGSHTSSAVASLPGHSGSAPAGQPLTQQRSDQDMVSFTRCMRSHGVQMSDPFHRPGHAGLTLDLPTRDSSTAAAYAACEHFIAAIEEQKAAGQATPAAPELAALTRYAQCMRRHDIGMLDPTPAGALSLGDVPGISSSYGRRSPQFQAADQACRHLLPADVHDDGTGP